MLFILFLFTFCLTFLVFIGQKQDFMAPAVLQCVMFTLCIFVALFNIDYWGIDYQAKTMFIMMAGIVAFVLPSFFFYTDKKGMTSVTEPKCIELINTWVLWLLLLVDILITVVYFYQVYQISLRAGNSMGVFGASYYYRVYVAESSSNVGVSTLINQFLKLGRGFGFVSIFILCYNLQVKKSVKGQIPLFGFVVIFALQAIIGGTRGLLLWIVGMAFTVSYVSHRKIHGFKPRDNRKYFVIALRLLIVVLVAFFLLKFLVRIGNNDNSLFSYISYYLSGSIQNFNLYIMQPAGQNTVWGQETFIGLYNTLDTFGLVDASAIYPTNGMLEFRVSNGVNIGNVYGAFRRYYQDFGVLGVITLQMICSIFFNALYKKVRYANSINNFRFFLYALFSYHLYEIAIDDFIYRSGLSFNMLTTVFVYYCVYLLFTRIKFRNFKIIIRHIR